MLHCFFCTHNQLHRNSSGTPRNDLVPRALHLLHLYSPRTLYAHTRLMSAHHLIRALRQQVTYSYCLACTRQTQGRNVEGGVALRNDPRPGCMVLPIVPNERPRAEQGKSYLSRECTAAASGLLPSRKNIILDPYNHLLLHVSVSACAVHRKAGKCVIMSSIWYSRLSS